jgi:hypothetical protein
MVVVSRVDAAEARRPVTISQSGGGATVALTVRHIVVVTADMESIFGHYYFAVQNRSAEPQRFSFPIMLPQETIDFRAQDGFAQEDLQIEGNKVVLSKEFPPGLTLLGINFQSRVAAFADDHLTFVMAPEIKEFSLAVLRSSGLELKGENFHEGLPHMLQSSTYRGIVSTEFSSGQKMQVVVQGVPKERNYLYFVAAIFAVFLLLGAGGFVWAQSRN